MANATTEYRGEAALRAAKLLVEVITEVMKDPDEWARLTASPAGAKALFVPLIKEKADGRSWFAIARDMNELTESVELMVRLSTIEAFREVITRG